MPNRNRARGTDTAGACPQPEAGTCPKAWYALRLAANREFKVQAALDALEIASFLPCWTEKVKWTDREKLVTRPLFPGYVFIASECREDLLAALRVPGVVQLLPNSFNPAPVGDNEIEDVRRVVALKLNARPAEFISGQQVVIDSGPLAGIKGTVVRTRGECHVVVSIEMLRRSIRVELDSDTLIGYSENPEC